MKKQKLLRRALTRPKNFRFADMITLVEAFGFRLARSQGSHHVFVHSNIPELLNLQDVKGQAKPYQINQFLRLVEQHNLSLGADE